MNKTARKASTDPAQEQLRVAKDTWNKKVSLLLDDLFEFKMLINGFRDDLHKPSAERLSLRDFLPASSNDINNKLLSGFENVFQEAHRIVEKQKNYSKTRKQKQIKSPVYNPNQLDLPFGSKKQTNIPIFNPKQLELQFKASESIEHIIKLGEKYSKIY